MILVTGGTGLVGSHLLFELLQGQTPIRTIYRAKSNFQEIKKVFSYYSDDGEALFNKIEWVEATINDVPALTKAFDGVTQVYHCAGVISNNLSAYRHMRKVNVEGTANIVNLCLDFKIHKLCHVSSIAAIGKEKNKAFVTEETPWNPDEENDIYGLTKYGAEMEVWRGTQEGLNAVVVNPGVIIGAGHWYSGSGILFSKVYKGLRFYPKMSTGFVGVRDVVLCMKQLMESSVKNQGFILVSENLPFKTLLHDIALSLGKKPPSRPLRKWMVALGWGLQLIGSLVFKTKRTITRNTFKSVFRETKYSNNKIVAALNFKFSSIKDDIKSSAKWFKKEV